MIGRTVRVVHHILEPEPAGAGVAVPLPELVHHLKELALVPSLDDAEAALLF